MHRIGTRFSLVVGVFALAFSLIILYRAWASAKRYAEVTTLTKAEVALAFDLAIREYVKESIRPEMEKRIGPDDFVLQAMSTSYVARAIVDKVRQRFPDYLLRFPSENPRNPVNQAAPEEVELLKFFRENSGTDTWKGRLTLGGTEYFAQASAMTFEESCMQCHGSPETAPQALLDRYGKTGGFHNKVGDLAGMDLVAIPTSRARATLVSHVKGDMIAMGVWLTALFVSICVAFSLIVRRRLTAITGHFQAAASQETFALPPIPESGNDEITVLAVGFNSLANRLWQLQKSLEEQVRERTAELSVANESLRREQKLLKQSLKMHDRERQVIAYEIHDGLAQQLVGAEMAFQMAEPSLSSDSRQEKPNYDLGMTMLARCIGEVRRLINGVRPPLLDEKGIVTAIQNLLAEDANGHAMPEFHHPATVDRMEPVVENTVYRIVQEAVTNARRHSGSDRICVSLVVEEDRLHVEVQDWGCGFDPKQKKSRAMGLRGIKKRAKLLGGQARIESEPGRGTRVIAHLPLTPIDDDSEDSDF